MTIPPGGKAFAQIGIPPEISARLDAGAKVAIDYGPIERVARGKFRRVAAIYLDNELSGEFEIRWEERESWLLALARDLGFCDRNNKPGLTVDLQIERAES